jgi:hypothetical protein
VLGTIDSKTFEEIWKSERYINFRKAVLLNRKVIDICSNCSEGTKVWA